MNPSNEFHTVFFDLDDTLYSPESGVWDAIGDRINLFMIERVGLDPQHVRRLRRQYFLEHGTTLNGLILFHQVDPVEYMDFVHEIPLEAYLSNNNTLKEQLEQMPQRRIVMTNASATHAFRVLKALGIDGEMDLVLDLFALDLINKPRPEAYQRALQLSEIESPGRCLYIDDQERNLPPAKTLGMTTVLVHRPSKLHEEDYSIESITDLVKVIPGLQRGS